mgnify:CR=1 FL=1
MTARPPRIVAMGGGGFSMEPDNLALDRHVLALTGKPRPKIAFVPTASGDADSYIQKFNAAFATLDCEPSILSLFKPAYSDLRDFVMAQDAIYVGGGNTYNMLALWRLHGLDVIFRDAWEAGVVLAGISAGALCWFDAGPTDSFGPLRAIPCLGYLPGALCVHYDGEADRRPIFQRMIAEGSCPAGFAADDGAAIVFEGTDYAETVTSRPDARSYRLVAVDGATVETALPVRYIGP